MIRDALGTIALFALLYVALMFGFVAEDGFGIFVPGLGGYFIEH